MPKFKKTQKFEKTHKSQHFTIWKKFELIPREIFNLEVKIHQNLNSFEEITQKSKRFQLLENFRTNTSTKFHFRSQNS